MKLPNCLFLKYLDDFIVIIRFKLIQILLYNFFFFYNLFATVNNFTLFNSFKTLIHADSRFPRSSRYRQHAYSSCTFALGVQVSFNGSQAGIFSLSTATRQGKTKVWSHTRHSHICTVQR